MNSNWDGIERRKNYDNMHFEHHEFIKALITKERRKQELWEKIKGNVGTWAFIIVLGFITLSLWDSILNYLKTKL